MARPLPPLFRPSGPAPAPPPCRDAQGPPKPVRPTVPLTYIDQGSSDLWSCVYCRGMATRGLSCVHCGAPRRAEVAAQDCEATCASGRYRVMVQTGVMTRNEARALEGLPPEPSNRVV